MVDEFFPVGWICAQAAKIRHCIAHIQHVAGIIVLRKESTSGKGGVIVEY